MSLELEIQVPDGVALAARVKGLQAADASGRFGLRPGHEAFLTLLVPCLLSYREESGREGYVAVDGGVLLLERDRVVVVTREAVPSDRSKQAADAAAEMLASRRRQEQEARTDLIALETALLRQLGELRESS